MAGGLAPKGGRKGRKIGKGKAKLSRSKWGSYAGLMLHLAARRSRAMADRFCKKCQTQFHSRNAFNRHECKGE